MTGASSKKPWWVRAFGGRGRWYTLVMAVFLTLSAASGLLNPHARGNGWWLALTVVGAILAVLLWATVVWQLRHRHDLNDGRTDDGR